MQRTSAILRYRRYGETAGEPVDRLHVEDIRARSSLHDWRIRPHVHGGIMQMLLVETGSVAFSLDSRRQTLDSPALVWVPGGVVHGFDFAPGTQGWVVSAVDDVLSEPALTTAGRMAERLRAAPIAQSLAHAPARLSRLSWLCAELARRFAHPDVPGDAALFWLFGLIVSELIGLETRPEAVPGTSPGHKLFIRFTDLIEAHLRDHWSVPDYAAALGVSAGQLARSCHKAVERSPGAVIKDRLLLEAKRRLIYTNATLARIADDLGYADPAYFSRDFKRGTGQSPGAFRHAAQQ